MTLLCPMSMYNTWPTVHRVIFQNLNVFIDHKWTAKLNEYLQSWKKIYRWEQGYIHLWHLKLQKCRFLSTFITKYCSTFVLNYNKKEEINITIIQPIVISQHKYSHLKLVSTTFGTINNFSYFTNLVQIHHSKRISFNPKVNWLVNITRTTDNKTINRDNIIESSFPLLDGDYMIKQFIIDKLHIKSQCESNWISLK